MAQTREQRERALKVKCPVCRQDPNEGCVRTGRRRSSMMPLVHTERIAKEDDRPKGGPPTVKQSFARRFVLVRAVDKTGTSGTGVVAEGVRFSNGKAAMHWLSHFGTVTVFDSMDCVEQLHGHGGDTKVVWRDDGYAGNCIACNIETEIGTEENPHPVPQQFHSCLNK